MADDKDIKKINDRITSVTTDIEKTLQQGGRDIDKGMKSVNKRFGASIEKLKTTNQALSKISLDSINTQKSTYSGALQGNKLLGLQSNLASVMEGTVDKSSEEFKKLEESFPDVDLSKYVNSHKKFMEASEENENLAFREQMLNGKKKALQDRQEQQTETILGKTEQYQTLLAETEKARQDAEKLAKEFALTGAAQTAKDLGEANTRRDELDKKAESVKKRTMESLDLRFAKEKETLELQGTKLDELKQQNQKVLDKQQAVKDVEETLIGDRMKEISEDSGRLGQFSDGLKTLTGFDLVGLADDVVKNIDAVGKVFGTEDLFQNLVMSTTGFFNSIGDGLKSGLEGLQSFISSPAEVIGKGVSSISSSLSAGFDTAKNVIGKGLSGILGGVKQMGMSLILAGKSMVMAATSSIKSGLVFLMAGASAMGMAILNAGRAMATAAAGMLSAVIPFIVAGLAFIGGLLMTAGSMLLTALPFIAIGVAILAAGVILYNAFMAMYENVGWFKGIIDTGISYIMNIGQAIFDIFAGMFDLVVGLFTGDFDRVMEGLTGMFGGLWDLLMAPFKAIGDFFKNVFDIDIGKMLRDFAAKILPNWLVKKIFGKEADAPISDEQAEAVDSTGEMSPAASAMATGLEDTDTQELINEREAQESQAYNADMQLRRRERNVAQGMRGSITVNGETLEGDAKREYLQNKADSGKLDYMDRSGVKTGFEGMTSAEIEQTKIRSEQQVTDIQGTLDERKDYAKSNMVATGEEDFFGDMEYEETGDRVKTAREMELESKTESEKAPINTAVTQQNNNQTNVTNNAISSMPVVNDNDSSAKLGYAVAF
jgi:hypothetical protein